MAREPIAPDVADRIARFVPRNVDLNDWLLVREFCTGVVTEFRPSSQDQARRLVGELAWLTIWAHCLAGYELQVTQVLHPQVIDEYVASRRGELGEQVRRQTRQRLRLVARQTNPDFPVDHNHGGPASVWRPEPYSPNELSRVQDWADGQRTALRRHRARCLLALGLGAGLTSGDVGRIRVGGVQVDELGVVLSVPNPAARLVPVRHEWAEFLAAVKASHSDSDHVFRPGRDAQTRGLLAGFVLSTNKDTSVSPVMSRMRSTWIVGLLAEGVPVSAIQRAAGLKSMRGYERWLTALPEVDDRAFRRLLSGA